MKRLSLIVTLLFLVLITTGCTTYYDIEAGKLTKCGETSDTGALRCNHNAYYETTDDGHTFTYCTSLNQWDCHPATPPASIQPSVSAQCTPNYAYDNLVNEGQSWEVVSQQQDQNNSTSPAQVTFTSTTSKTVTVTDKLDVIANLGVNADLLIADITLNVKAEIDHEVTQTVNATIGNAYTASIPPGETAYANYGVKVQITGGHLYDKAGCEGKKSNWGTDVTYVPIAAGWCVWLSNQPPCPSL